MIDTTHGPMDETLLERREGVGDPPVGPLGCRTFWVEYWLDGEVVHRSVIATAPGVSLPADATFADAKAALGA